MRPRSLHLERLESRRVQSAGGFVPQVSLPPRITVVEDTATPLRVSVFDRDSGVLTVRIQVSSGVLAVKATAGATVDFPGGGAVVVAGSRSAVARTLETVVFRTAPDHTVGVTMTVSASDGVNQFSRVGQIRITPVNDAPTLSVAGRTFAVRGTLDLGRYPLYDPDSARLTVTIRSDNGSVRILDPAARNLGSEARLGGTWRSINGIIGTPGRIVLGPAAGRNTRLTISATDGVTTTTKFVTVSHRENLPQVAAHAVDSRIRGKDPAAAKPVFSVMDHATATYVRNTAAWTHDLDLTCISPWNSAGGGQMGGTLVSPRHVVYATHFRIPVGATMRFVSRDNEVVERTIVGSMSPPYAGNLLFPDITVAVLDSDVPASIGFARILPDDWAAHLPDGNLEIPCLALDQEEKALVTELRWLGDEATFFEPRDESRRSFFESIVIGDSGNPGFMIVDGQLVLLTVWTYGSGGLGTFVTRQRFAIDRMMAELGGGHRLATVDLARLGRL